MKQSLKVLLLLGFVVATQAAGPVTKKLGEVRRKNLAQAEVEIGDEASTNFYNIPEACLVTANAIAPTVSNCTDLEPSLDFCECEVGELPALGHGHVVK